MFVGVGGTCGAGGDSYRMVQIFENVANTFGRFR